MTWTQTCGRWGSPRPPWRHVSSPRRRPEGSRASPTARPPLRWASTHNRGHLAAVRKHPSAGLQLALINSMLSSLPMCMTSFFAAPRGLHRKLDYSDHFFFKSDEYRQRGLCQPKEQGGLKIHICLDIKNIALLSMCLFKLLSNRCYTTNI
jgi:hypothetical protein